MTETTYSIGVIGLGIMGRRMIANVIKHFRLAISGAWDPDSRACADAAAETPDLAIMADADAVIARADLIYVATPPLWHREYADRAMVAEKPLYCEKPLGIDVESSRDLVATLDNSYTPNVVNFIQASSRAVTLTKERVDNGAWVKSSASISSCISPAGLGIGRQTPIGYVFVIRAAIHARCCRILSLSPSVCWGRQP